MKKPLKCSLQKPLLLDWNSAGRFSLPTSCAALACHLPALLLQPLGLQSRVGLHPLALLYLEQRAAAALLYHILHVCMKECYLAGPH
eukprot:7771110-Karenia_brevis.AAC.1